MKKAKIGDIVIYCGCEVEVCGVGTEIQIRVTDSLNNQNISPTKDIEYGDGIGQWQFPCSDKIVSSTLSDFESMDNNAFASATPSIWGDLAPSK